MMLLSYAGTVAGLHAFLDAPFRPRTGNAVLSGEVDFCPGCRQIVPVVDHFDATDDDGGSDYSHSSCALCLATLPE